MSKVLITTTVSDDTFQYYIPLFVYTAKRAYPQYTVKIFCVGKLREPVAKILKQMQQEEWCDPNFEILEEQFTEIRKFRRGSLNALRHLLPEDQLK